VVGGKQAGSVHGSIASLCRHIVVGKVKWEQVVNQSPKSSKNLCKNNTEKYQKAGKPQ
jgi:hypothetical protein